MMVGKVLSFSLILVIIVGVYAPLGVVHVEAQEDSLTPNSVAIHGEIIDNYSNITYTMSFDNTDSSEARQASWFFGFQEGIRLSNISVEMKDLTLWGRIMEEVEAEETYNESVEANATAALVIRRSGGYEIKINVENNTGAVLQVFAEGLLTRELGIYEMTLPLAVETALQAEFDMVVDIQSTCQTIEGYSVVGIGDFQATDLGDGVRLSYYSENLLVPPNLALKYVVETEGGCTELVTYNNGTDNFFVYKLAPTIQESENQAPREYVFVLDVSGSMSGSKIEQAKVAFSSMVEDLGEDDIFNLVKFNEEVALLWDEPHSASSLNVETAQEWVSSITAEGSTNFHGACLEGLNTFTSGDYVKVMLLLSDGLPTAGELQLPEEIIPAVCEANTKGVSISTVAFGAGADENLLASIAAKNHGYFAFVQPDDDASTRLMDFYKKMSVPLAKSFDISINGASEIMALQSLDNTPFFNGSEIVIAGRYSESIQIATSIEYVSGNETYDDQASTATSENCHIEKIWALQRIDFLKLLVLQQGETESLR
ncbi:MAG: VWA domain-containing protein, partial [Candidatus Thorarchaeota archaeon]|nr:VWA domain-containing protein [Candidatus Thorarchaeota archaeon]